MDCVVQFALENLGFLEEQIVFFSWSIGGFSASWGAANYPGCKALVSPQSIDFSWDSSSYSMLILHASCKTLWQANQRISDLGLRYFEDAVSSDYWVQWNFWKLYPNTLVMDWMAALVILISITQIILSLRRCFCFVDPRRYIRWCSSVSQE